MTPLREELAGKTHTTVVVMLAASAALLLIGCVNLANLLMSRGAVRGREVAVRTALGAGRGRLIAQFLTESLVLAGVGAAAGLALAVPAMRFLESVVPETMGAVQLTLDWRVLAFSAGVTIAAALTFGLVPALRGSRVAPHDGLRDGGRGTMGARSQWLQHALIVTQTALAVVLLTSGGLLLQTFQHLRNTDLGMQTEKLLTFETPLFRYGDNEKRIAFVNAQLDAIRAIPGVVNAGATSQIPLRNMDAQATFYWLQGQTKDQVKGQVALMRVVTHQYLQTIGARLREGRYLESSDRRSESPVAIVNESFANRNFPGRSAIGARFKYGNLGDKGYWYTIVGVVKEIHEVGMAEDLRPAVYRTHEQSDQVGSLPGGIAVRTSVEPTTIVASVRQAIQALDPNMPIANVRTAEDIFGRELSTPTQSTSLLGAFAVLALLLASIGLYGVLSYAVTQRTNEIGVRMALGATPGEILWSVSRRGLALTVAGLMIGLALTPLAAQLMTALLYGFQPHYAMAAATVSRHSARGGRAGLSRSGASCGACRSGRGVEGGLKSPRLILGCANQQGIGMTRREFCLNNGRVALGIAFAPALMLRPQQSIGPRDAAWKRLLADLEHEIEELMTKAQVPGLSIALVSQGALAWRRGFGIKDIRSKAPVEDNTVFEAASTSKPLFAYLVMKLCERGVLELDTPLVKYVPERLVADDARPDLVTARHVLSHTSGLPNWRSKQEPLAFQFTPGERWLYSGEGYSHLQAAVSRLTGSQRNPTSVAASRPDSRCARLSRLLTCTFGRISSDRLGCR